MGLLFKGADSSFLFQLVVFSFSLIKFIISTSSANLGLLIAYFFFSGDFVKSNVEQNKYSNEYCFLVILVSKYLCFPLWVTIWTGKQP